MSKQINLTKGYVTIVDDDDFEFLSQFHWVAKISGGNRVYAVKRNPSTGRHTYLHKLLVSQDGKETDHINGNSLDNRRNNLRPCTHAQNLQNSKLQNNNTTGYRGVHFHKQSKKYQVYIKYNGKRIGLGFYDDIIVASKVYDAKALELFGEYANLNWKGIQDE